jgi:hypothetical protein
MTNLVKFGALAKQRHSMRQFLKATMLSEVESMLICVVMPGALLRDLQ